MTRRAARFVCVLLAVLAIACAPGDARTASTSTPGPTAAIVTTTPTASPTPQLVRVNIRASRLAIPTLNLDAPVGASQVVPDTSTVPPGCPAPPPGQETFTVPDQGIVTPADAIEGLENKAWIFGHSRWQNVPGLFFRLQDMSPGDELFVDGIDRTTGAPVGHRRFVVDGIYLADIPSGGKLVTAASPSQIPAEPVVILQTSVREDGVGKQWLLDQQKVLAKSRNVVQGDLNDYCKYLLLFVFARAS